MKKDFTKVMERNEELLSYYQFFAQRNSGFLVASFISRTATTENTDSSESRLCHLHISLLCLFLHLLALGKNDLRDQGRSVENENKVSIFFFLIIIIIYYTNYYFQPQERVRQVNSIYREGKYFLLRRSFLRKINK